MHNRRGFINSIAGIILAFRSQGTTLVPVVGGDRSIGAGVRGEILNALRPEQLYQCVCGLLHEPFGGHPLGSAECKKAWEMRLKRA